MEEPLKVMQLAQDSLEIMQAMAETGIPNYVSDAGIGALCVSVAVEGAFLNVKINASVCDDKKFVEKILKKAESLSVSAKKKETDILKIVEEKI